MTSWWSDKKTLTTAIITAHTVEYNGIIDTYKGWSARTGVKKNTIRKRINKQHWPISKALGYNLNLSSQYKV